MINSEYRLRYPTLKLSLTIAKFIYSFFNLQLITFYREVLKYNFLCSGNLYFFSLILTPLQRHQNDNNYMISPIKGAHEIEESSHSDIKKSRNRHLTIINQLRRKVNYSILHRFPYIIRKMHGIHVSIYSISPSTTSL